MNITVYLGASDIEDRKIIRATQDLGHWIGSHGHRLIYGGSKSGLMGILADSVLEKGGQVVGIEPEMFIDSELQHDGITELIVTKDFNERKGKMMEMGDCIVVMPGGTGTLEEASEVLCRIHLNMYHKKIMFLNLNKYYEPLFSMMEQMINYGFVDEDYLDHISFANDVDILTWGLQGVADKLQK